MDVADRFEDRQLPFREDTLVLCGYLVRIVGTQREDDGRERLFVGGQLSVDKLKKRLVENSHNSVGIPRVGNIHSGRNSGRTPYASRTRRNTSCRFCRRGKSSSYSRVL